MQVCYQVINAGEPLKMMQIGCLNHFSLLKPKEVKYMTFNHNLIVLSLLAVVSSASAQSLDSKNFHLYGGTYSVKCADKQAATLTIFADRLVYKFGDRNVVATNIDTSYSSYGPVPPKGFQLSIMGQTSPGIGLMADVYSGNRGKHVLLNGHPDAMKAIGRKDEDASFVFCGK